jgi:hypothetical protein
MRYQKWLPPTLPYGGALKHHSGSITKANQRRLPYNSLVLIPL